MLFSLLGISERSRFVFMKGLALCCSHFGVSLKGLALCCSHFWVSLKGLALYL